MTILGQWDFVEIRESLYRADTNVFITSVYGFDPHMTIPSTCPNIWP